MIKTKALLSACLMAALTIATLTPGLAQAGQHKECHWKHMHHVCHKAH
ncbi:MULTISPECIES: hypothetical protein [unclassified Caballeronia]|nr:MULTISPECIES: hypothetical protein [unclassified Caballeronia]MDR5752762.1 hypothetical protein [Caballeronia sp. LZ024]MDR5841404.1 hypothetical protein [Caballeronia sp. LZ031]